MPSLRSYPIEDDNEYNVNVGDSVIDNEENSYDRNSRYLSESYGRYSVYHDGEDL